MTNTPRRWVFATIHQLGWIVFETADAYTEGTVEAYKLSAVLVNAPPGEDAEITVTRLRAYDFGLMQDPVILNAAAFITASHAPKTLAEGARAAWSDIVVPNNGQFPGRRA